MFQIIHVVLVNSILLLFILIQTWLCWFCKAHSKSASVLWVPKWSESNYSSLWHIFILDFSSSFCKHCWCTFSNLSSLFNSVFFCSGILIQQRLIEIILFCIVKILQWFLASVTPFQVSTCISSTQKILLLMV